MLAADAALTAADVDQLARATEGFSCSDLLRLCQDAAQAPAKEAAAAAAAATVKAARGSKAAAARTAVAARTRRGPAAGGAAAAVGADVAPPPGAQRPIELSDFTGALQRVAPSVGPERLRALVGLAREWAGRYR